MKKTLALMAAVLALGMTVAVDAEARRLGGGRAAGMQRQQVMPPSRTAPPATNPGSPAQAAPAAGTAAAGTAAAAAPARSWMGPVAGIAAGLGLAALASHFGFGEALANVMTIALLGMLAVAAIGFVMRKRAAPPAGLAGAGAGAGAGTGASGAFARGGSLIGSNVAGPMAASAAATGNIPADFDKAGFERTARDQFMALQTANDARDLDRLRDYLTPEMFEAVRAEVTERGDAPQQTEVFSLQAQVIDVADEGGRYVVSVRFTGSIREQFGAPTEDLDEVWHLAKPKSGFGGWVIAGIQQVE
jgi:predicted lipid-binding transport protein (Tim44 family)